jgi:carbonic anhydrase/acetyltransferase-like protein (isoleucine patch superfamily)
MATIRSYGGKAPRLHETAFVSDGVLVIGDVEVGAQSSIWFGSIVRGDVHFIRIGARTNVQDQSIIHVTHDTHPTVVGDDVTLGHRVTLHGCTIRDRCLIGIGATVLDGAVVGPDAVVAAGAVVPPGMVVPPGKMVMGTPARVTRDLRPDELEGLLASARNYVAYMEQYRREGWSAR